MRAEDLAGIYSALPTPMDGEGRPDIDALRALIADNLAHGVAGFVPVGGTGEYTALSPDDRVAVVRHTVEEVAGRVPVVPGILSPGFAEATAAGEAFRAAGADGLMLVTPFYVVPRQDGAAAYFRAFRREVDLPVVYYDVPSRTGFVTAPETVAALAGDGTIIGMKVCNTDAYYFHRLAAALEGRIALLSGDDMLYAVHVMQGAVGGVLASAPLLPRYWAELHAMLARGEWPRAVEAHRKLIPVFDALFANVNPGPLKATLNALGFPVGDVHLPLLVPDAAAQALIERAVDHIRRHGMR